MGSVKCPQNKPNLMQSKATTVTEYLREVPADRLDALLELRDLCLQTLTSYKETMLYGMPTYSLDNEARISWNSEKNYISIYINRSAVLEKFKPLIKKADFGKSCIRYRRPADIDWEIIKTILTAELNQ